MNIRQHASLNFNLNDGNITEANKELYNFTMIPFDEIGTVKFSQPSFPLSSPSSTVVKPSNSQTRPKYSSNRHVISRERII